MACCNTEVEQSSLTIIVRSSKSVESSVSPVFTVSGNMKKEVLAYRCLSDLPHKSKTSAWLAGWYAAVTPTFQAQHMRSQPTRLLMFSAALMEDVRHGGLSSEVGGGGVTLVTRESQRRSRCVTGEVRYCTWPGLGLVLPCTRIPVVLASHHVGCFILASTEQDPRRAAFPSDATPLPIVRVGAAWFMCRFH